MPAVLMTPAELVDVKTAADYARRSDKTLRRWAREYRIGRQAMGSSRMEISRLGLEMVLADDAAALELWQAGDRAAPQVRRYIEHLGLPE